MKRVFACLSTLLLMLVVFGLAMQPIQKVSAVEVADGKFIEDPTLQEGDIPIYVMNSIRTTFPAYYDNDAVSDPNYGPGRDYGWNEIKLVIPQMADNALTGSQYTVYTQGETASKIYIWGLTDEGKITTATQTKSSYSWTGTYAPLFGDVSLSGVRYNLTGQEVHINNVYNENGVGNGDHSTDFIYIIFDGQGKAVRGVAHDNYFAAENVAQYGFNLVFGYKDGKLVLRSDVIGAGKAVNGFEASDANLDRVQLEVDDLDNPLLDEVTGEPLVDDDGNPLYNKKFVDGEEAKVLTGKRYIWQWFSEEDFDAAMVNSVQYLEEGWRYDLWDYAFADPNGGYVCLAFTPSLSKFAQLDAQQSEIHNASIRALVEAGELDAEEAAALLIEETVTVDATTQEEVVTYATVERPVVVSLTIPVDGISYRYGYLDYAGAGVTEMHFDKFCRIFEQGLLFGRNAAYRAHARTCNFSAAGLKAQNALVDGQSFILREENGKLVYELKAGATIKPSDIISIKGMLGGYLVAGDGDEASGSNVHAVQSYKDAPADELEYTMDINGEAVMRPVIKQYETLEPVKADFLDALLNWKRGKGVAIDESTDWGSFANNTYGKFADGDLQLFAEEVPAWAWMIEYYTECFTAQAAADGFTTYDVTQANGARWGLYAFMNGIKHDSWPKSPDFTAFDYSGIKEYSPELVYRYETWEEFVEDFLAAFNEYVYGKVQVENPGQWWDMTYTASAELQAKQIAFFQQPEWKFVDELVDELCAAQGWTSYDKTHYYRYRCSMYAILNKAYRDVWPKSIDCRNMSDPKWIGVPLEKDYTKVVYSTEGMSAPSSFTLELTTLNKTTGVAGSIQVQFEVVNVFTPVIRVDADALVIKDEQTSIDLTKAVKAYDGEYAGESIYGSDISRQYLKFELPQGFDPEHLKGGLYTITVKAFAPADTGLYAETKFQIRVLDNVAPVGDVNKVVSVVAGEQLDVRKVLIYAYDDVDGDFLRSASVNWIWYILNTDYDPQYSQIGEELAGSIVLVDNNGNMSRALRFTVLVCGTDTVTVGPGEDPTEETASFNCGNAGMIAAGLLAAAGLAFVILRKKH